MHSLFPRYKNAVYQQCMYIWQVRGFKTYRLPSSCGVITKINMVFLNMTCVCTLWKDAQCAEGISALWCYYDELVRQACWISFMSQRKLSSRKVTTQGRVALHEYFTFTFVILVLMLWKFPEQTGTIYIYTDKRTLSWKLRQVHMYNVYKWQTHSINVPSR